MKKILFVSALAILMGISVSCQKELNNGQAISAGEGTASSLVVTATIADNGTKVSYQENDTDHSLKPSWTVDDIIIGFDGDGNTYGYKVTEVNDGKATLVIETSGDYKGSKTEDPADGTKMYMIYAPGTNPSAISDKSLTVSLANQAKDVVPALMMAEATVTDGSLSLSFSNQTAIIGIKNPTMASASTNYTSIALSGSGIKTEVKFDLSGEGGALNASYQTSGTITKAVDFTSGTGKEVTGVTYIVACPLETSADLTFTADYGETFTKTGKTIDIGKYYYMTPIFEQPRPLFTVKKGTDWNPDTKVSFAPGNLYAKKESSTWKWGFYEKQYQFHSSSMPQISTSGGSRTAAAGDTEIDLFTWGYDNNSTNNSYSLNPVNTVGITGHNSDGDQFGTNEDWGSITELPTAPSSGDWRTLTKDEWVYLLNTRTSSTVNGKTNARYLKCKVNNDTRDVYGLMLFPDTFTWPTGAGDAPTSGINTANLAWTSVPSYTSVQFEALDGAGVVFLPAAGYRDGASVSNVGSSGYYWSSTAYGSSIAYFLNLNGGNIGPADYYYRSSGRSVRLVSVVQ